LTAWDHRQCPHNHLHSFHRRDTSHKKPTHPTTWSHLSFIYVFDHWSPSSSFTPTPHPPHELHKRPSVHCFLFAIIISLKPNALNEYKTMVSYCFMFVVTSLLLSISHLVPKMIRTTATIYGWI
jgi:hypothetical protein